ncbi:MAG: dihydrofolate reductase [Bacteroidetes bacterium]|jgi:dihydrofolate reductase|nr:dihydrofolate reductase [Bacteroidota bacterium]
MITLVVAMGKNGEIGLNNQLLWHMPKDLQHFKKITSGHPIIMGRKTFESIGKPLPNRTNIVVSRKENWFQEGILIVGSLKEAIKFAQKIDENIMIIGGAEIFKQTIDIADKLEVTLVDEKFSADTFFPSINPKKWSLSHEEFNEKDEKNPYNFCFQTFEKIN